MGDMKDKMKKAKNKVTDEAKERTDTDDRDTDR